MASGSERRIVFVDHTAMLSGAELCLLDTAPHFPGSVVSTFEDGPLVTALRARGVEVTVLGATGAIQRVRRDGSVFAGLRAAPAVLRLVRELAVQLRPGDILYANSQKAWIVAALAGRLRRVHVVWHLHDIMSAAHFSRSLTRVAVALANRFAAAVIVNSAVTGQAFAAVGGRAELLRVVHNGIDEAPFVAVTEAKRAALRAQLGIAAAGATVGVFGRITPWKGQHVLLQALRELRDVHALVVGDALFGEEPYRTELLALAASPELAGRVRFLGHRADVPELMKAVDIVVHTSVAPEPFGRVIVEGLLAERPVIATAAGGVTEVIADGVHGLLVPPNEAGALASAIRALVSDRERARRLAAAGCKRARERFLVGAMRTRLASELAKIG